MNQAAFVNLLIVLVVIVGLVTLQNPLFILGLLFLRDLPYGLAMQAAQYHDEGDDEDSRPIGFTADV